MLLAELAPKLRVCDKNLPNVTKYVLKILVSKMILFPFHNKEKESLFCPLNQNNYKVHYEFVYN